MVGIICPKFEIGVTVLPKSGGVMAPTAPPAPTALRMVVARARGFRQKEADLKWTHKN